MTPLEAFDIVMLLEGGGKLITDSGGLTKWGVSQRAYPNLDIANLTKEQAFGLFVKDCWNAVSAHSLPSPLNLLVADAAYNQGPARAIHMLQKALGTVAITGVIDRRTFAAIDKLPVAEVCARFNTVRCMTYMGTRGFPKYGNGWLNRIGRLMMELTKWKTLI